MASLSNIEQESVTPTVKPKKYVTHRCFFFQEGNFFGGFPPQACVTEWLLKELDAGRKYDKFPVRDSEMKSYEFLEWDDPIAEAVWKPFLETGKHVTFSTYAELEERAGYSGATSSQQQQEALDEYELYKYNSTIAAQVYNNISTDAFDDPTEALLSLVYSPFSPTSFSGQIDKAVWQFLIDKGKDITANEFLDYSLDLTTSSLQKLTKPFSSVDVKVTNMDSVELVDQLSVHVAAKQPTKFSLLFLRHLAKLDDTANVMMKKITSISTALHLTEQNEIIEPVAGSMKEFLLHYFPTIVSDVEFVIDKLHHKYAKEKPLEDSILKWIMEKCTIDLSPVLGSESGSSINTRSKGKGKVSTDDFEVVESPEYTPQSPGKETVEVRTISVDTFQHVIHALFCYYRSHYMDDFKPSKYVQKIYGYRNASPDFIRRVCKSKKIVFFEQSFHDRIRDDILNFLEEYQQLPRSSLKPLGLRELVEDMQRESTSS